MVSYPYLGDQSEADPPVPIPNTEVKRLSADDTWGATLWENRPLPGCFSLSAAYAGVAFLGRLA